MSISCQTLEGPFVVMYQLNQKDSNSSGFYRLPGLIQLYEFITQFGYKLLEHQESEQVPLNKIISAIKSLPHFKIHTHHIGKKGSSMKTVPVSVIKGYKQFMRQRANDSLEVSKAMLQYSQSKSNIKSEILKILNAQTQNQQINQNQHNPDQHSIQ